MSRDPLSNVRVVLVNTTHPGNIGAAARAMKNMGLTRLYLVAPSGFPGVEATARAAGADDVLGAAHVCPTLADALRGCHLVIGTSARPRTIAWPMLTPEMAARQLVAETAQGEVALLFGQERTGLTNDELDRCHALVAIPANPEFASLNLAAAVQILAYELRMAVFGSPVVDMPVPETPLATDEDVQRLYRHMEEVLIQIRFLDPGNPRKLMRRLMRLFNRVRLDSNELNILRGILTAVQQGWPRDT
jgi:TrmH family RNA methyltransferase